MSHVIAMLSLHTSPLAMPGSAKDAGGMNVYMRELARELGRIGTTVDIFTRRTSLDQPLIVSLAPGVRVIHIEAGPPVTLHKSELYQHIPEFVRNASHFVHSERGSYALIHSHYWISGVAGQQLAQIWRIPHVTMFHTLAHLKQLANPAESEPALRLEMERQLIQQADRIIATTQEERTQIILHCGALSAQVAVIPCGVDLRRFAPRDRWEARVQLGLHPEQPVLLFVGRLDPFKGPDVFLRSAALMQQSAQLLLVGGALTGDPDLEKLRQLACDLQIQQRVSFLGARSQEELPLIYSAAAVTVVPSYHESFSLAAVESLACGTPVVATRAGGLMTVVRPDENGYLVARKPGLFAERLDHLLSHPATLTRMFEGARSSVLQYSWQSVAARMSEVYAQVLNKMEEGIGEALEMVAP